MKIAHCDIGTGEIYGCKKGSWEWWHEKGHLEFNKIPEKSFLILTRGYALDILLLLILAAIVWNPMFYLAVPLWLYYMGVGLYEEWWCNQYANKSLAPSR